MNTIITGCYSFCILNQLLFTLIIWSRKQNTWKNIVFGFYIVLFAITMIFNLAVYTGILNASYYHLCIFPALMVGPTIFLFISLYGKWTPRIKHILGLHFIFSMVLAIILSIGTIMLANANITIDWLSGHGMPNLFRTIIVIHGCVYHYYSWSHFRKNLNNNQYSENEKNKMAWIYDFLTSMLILCALFVLFHSIRYLIIGSSTVGSSIISPLIYSISYLFILKKCIGQASVFENKTDQLTAATKKIVRPNLSPQEIAAIDGKLLQALEKEKIFRNIELNLNLLAEHIDINSKELSQFINQQYNINFSDFINKYRVEESVKIMQDPSTKNLKLEAIAEIAGFSSRASFFSVFKKVTGQTPASFRKNLDL